MNSRDQGALLVSVSKLDFEQARIKHMLFKSKLRAMLYGVEIDKEPVLSHTACALGKWIYDIAMPRIGHMTEVRRLERVHAGLHQLANRLWQEYRAGNKEIALKGLDEMEVTAKELLYLLDVIEQKALS